MPEPSAFDPRDLETVSPRAAPIETFDTVAQVRMSASHLIDERLASSTDIRELVVLTQLRGELVRQEEVQADGVHRRALERLQVYYKLIAAPVAFGTGVAFVALTPLVGVGLFLIGAGLAAFVPDYVRMVLYNKGEREREP